jgi:uncharacterized protein YggE
MSKAWTAAGAALAGVAIAMLAGWVGPTRADTDAVAAPAVPTQTGDLTEPRTITGTGTGRIRGTPDTMTVDIGVETRASSAKEALARNRERADAVFEALRNGGVPEEDIQTSSLYVSPVFDDDGDRITGYEVSNSVTATMHELDKAGAVIDAAASVAGNDVRISGVYFTIEDTSELVAKARAEAVKAASAQAQQLAAAAGIELGDVMSIEETTTPLGPPVEYDAEEDAGGSTPINPGSQELMVDVTVRFAIG